MSIEEALVHNILYYHLWRVEKILNDKSFGGEALMELSKTIVIGNGEILCKVV